MKVVYVHHSSIYGGSSRSLGILIKNLLPFGLEPYVICPKGGAEAYFRTITDNVLPVTYKAFPLHMTVAAMSSNGYHFVRNFERVRYVKNVTKLIREINPDLVHFNEIGLSLNAKQIYKLGIPIVMHARTMPHKSFPFINSYAIKQVQKYSDHLISISGSVDNWLQDIKNRSIVYNPIESIPTINSYDESKKQFTLASLSAIQKSKGVFDILEAARVLKEDERVIFKIAGKINLPPAQMSIKLWLLAKLGILDFSIGKQFLRYVKEHNLKNVQLLGHISDLSQLLTSTDIMLAPMHLNAPPRSVYEAGKYGIPSILAMEDKVFDVVADGVNGLVIDEQAPEQLVEAILKMIDNPALIAQYGLEARERCIERHEPSKCAGKVYEIYSEVLARRN